MPRPMLRRVLTLIAVVAVLGATACGDDDESSNGGGSAGQEQGAGAETTPSADALKDTTTKPVIPKPTGTPPRKLVRQDIVKGKGPGAKAGNTVIVNYVGVNFSNGQEFDSSWDSGAPFPV